MSTRAEPSTPRLRLSSWGLAYTPAVAFALLLPKCPLCIAAPLALLGVTIPLPDYARGLAIALSVVLGSVYLLARHERGRGGSCACSASRVRKPEHTVAHENAR